MTPRRVPAVGDAAGGGRTDAGDATQPTVGDATPTQPTTPLEALGVLATQSVMLTPALRHVELYTMRGLLTILWHEPETAGPGAIVACGGAMGGLLGPAEGLYHRLGVEWAERGVPVLRISYRRPNDLDACCMDVAAAVQLAVGGGGAERVVVMGHSFGGAVAVRVGVGLSQFVAGVATFATQSAGCEVAGGLEGRPLLLFHGDRDEILPPEASEMVRMIAGSGEVVHLPGDGHLLAKSGDILWERLEEWLPATLSL
jgi:predicted alpha/beta hydrolase family esterase